MKTTMNTTEIRGSAYDPALMIIYLSIYLPDTIYLYLPIHPSIHPSIHSPMYIYIYIYIFFFARLFSCACSQLNMALRSFDPGREQVERSLCVSSQLLPTIFVLALHRLHAAMLPVRII